MAFSFLRRIAGVARHLHVFDRRRQVVFATIGRRASGTILQLEVLEDRTLPSATILQAYNFTGTSGAEISQNPDTVAANVTGGAITRGSGLLANNQNNVWGFGNAISSVPTGNVYGTSLASAAALNQYYQFTASAQSGYSLSLSGVSFNAYAQIGESTFSAALQYSVDGGNTFNAAALTGSLSGASQRSPLQVSANLSGIGALQNETGSVVFRIYLFGVNSYEDSGIGQTSSDNDLQITGTVNTVINTLPSATILQAYNFTGTSGAEISQNPDTVAANVTGGAITRGSGLLANNQNNVWGFGNAISSVPTGNVYGTSLASAAALNQYYQFTASAQSGYSLSLSGVSFNAYAQIGESTFSAALQYSVDGGNTFSAAALTGSLSGASERSPLQVSANLSGIGALQNETGSVVFRIYLFGVNSFEDSGIGQTSSDNDLQITGTVNTVINTSGGGAGTSGGGTGTGISGGATAAGVVADNAGGGWTGGGIVGQYYNNTTFSGAPSFTRTDDRIDFASNSQAPGGSTSPGFSAVGATNFSVLWTGSLIPAFTQTYTFDGFAADTFTLQISPAGTNNWTTIVNQTSYTGKNFSGTYNFTAGETYNVKIQFVQFTGPWAAQLRWNSPVTPDQVINPLSDSGINAVTYDNRTYADAIKMGATQWNDPTTSNVVATDANGWPMADAYNIVWQGANGPEMAGTYLLQFNGLANVSISLGFATFTVNGQTYNALPSGMGYNAATNTTTALVNVSDSATILFLYFTKSQRTLASAVDTGVTNVHLMRPTSPGATTYYPVGTVFDANLEAEYANFTVERWLTANFDTTQVSWSQRILPGNAEANYSDRDEVWEYEVMLANETGKDLYITLPMNANAQYVTDLAELIKYGSNGVNPYTSYQTNPVYPGLNLNLHVYIEWSNETWNYAFNQAGAGITDAQEAVVDYLAGNTGAADYAEGAIIDYDGQAPTGDFRRWTALMIVQASNIFRSVWGNAAMGNQVRPLLEYQYDNDQDTALAELEFINDYFNNGNGLQNVKNPEPVSYYLWGSGAAVYYSSPDPLGTQTAITVPDASFETPVIAANTDVLDPSGSSWTFTGNAGIYKGSGTMGSLGAVQVAPDGSQAAFIGDTGSLNTTISFTQTGTFAIQLYAANKSGYEDGLRIYLNGQEITPDYLNDPNYANPFDDPWVPGQYIYGINDAVYNSLGTAPFTISTLGNYTLTIVGTGAVGTYTFLDDLQVTSLAAIFNAGVPGIGQANGQPQQALASYQTELNAQATYAETFGLHVVAYEGGWSLGGDGGVTTPLQNYAKYMSAQATQANVTSYDDFLQSGGALYVYGTYDQWPGANTPTANSFPLLQGVDATNNILPLVPTNGVAVPATLTPSDATLADGNIGRTLSTSGYISWNIFVPAYGSYTITAGTGSGGKAQVMLDDATTIASGVSGGTLSGSVNLTAGLHTILVEATGGSFSVTQVAIAPANALAAPVLNSALSGNAEVTLAWSAVSGATGYRVRYGTSAGVFTTSYIVGNVLTFTVPGLTNGQAYYFAVDAFNAIGDSLPSNAFEEIPTNPGTVTTVANWSFSGFVGNETSAPVTVTTSLVSATPLVRSSGLLNDGNTNLTANTFSSGANGNVFAANPAAAIIANQYYQLTITPAVGETLSVQTLDFSPWFQNATGLPSDPRGAAITWSIDGQNFSGALIAAGTPNYSPSPFTVDLSGQAALQNTSSTVTFRIYLYGNGNYETCGLGGISVLGRTTSSAIATTTAVTALSTLTAKTTTAVTFTATVTASSGGSAPNNGVVEFLSGTTLLATATATTTSGSTATFSVTSFVPAGTFSGIQAFYIPGGTGFASSSSVTYGSTLTVYAPPVFSGATSASIVAGSGASQVQTFSGVTASGNATFSLINLPPAWVTINAITGVLTFGQNAAVPNYSSTKNTWTITIQAASPGGVVTETFTIILTPGG